MRSKNQNISIFIAYSRRDTTYLDELLTHLRPLEKLSKVQIWYDGKIEAGTNWEDEIKVNLHKAEMILMLLSAGALASDYFYDKEMAEALKRHERGETIVIPVILEPCLWKITPFGQFQALPKDGVPVCEWSNASSAFANVVQGINSQIENIEFKKKQRDRIETSGDLKNKEKANTHKVDEISNKYGGKPLDPSPSDDLSSDQKTRKGDLRITLLLSKKEIKEGTKKSVKVKKNITCGYCKGSGAVESITCNSCEGLGKIPGEEIIKIQVPANINDGDQLRLMGAGDAGGVNGPDGNLFVVIKEKGS